MSDNQHTILIIDDDLLLASSIASQLMDAGYENIEVAHNGSDGVKVSLEKQPEVILLDYQMPDIDGIEVLERIRQDEWGKRANVIFMTNTDDLAVINKAIGQGVSQYLLKADTGLDQIVDLVNRQFQTD